jgi:hypothetical protein
MGEQHYVFNKFFHGTRDVFLAQQERDRRKEMWCEINDITLVKIPFSDNIDKVIETIKGISDR